MLLKYYIFSAFVFIYGSCPNQSGVVDRALDDQSILPGAYSVDSYVDLIRSKQVGLVVNHTSMIGNTHVVDSLMSLDVDVRAVFAPEHGFKGGADAGAQIADGVYKGEIPVYSLYGKTKKPTTSMLDGLDMIIFDIQDVGARFYTYLSTLHYVMEAAAERNIPVIILDRPNPNAHLIDGPIMDMKLSSFVGLHPVPIVYGMTIGEYGHMINGERWLANKVQADLTVIPCTNYNHNSHYILPISPSPNLPNQRSILLYPSLCLFEATTVSIGRGTDQQFQVIGHPQLEGKYQFTPVSGPGSKYPKHQDVKCTGYNLSQYNIMDLYDYKQLNFSFITESYKLLSRKGVPFFNENNFFEKLAGTDELRRQISAGMTEAEIRATWQDGLREFKITRSKYLLY